VLVGSGSALPGLEGVRRSRSEATIAYRTAERIGGTAGLVRFADLGVERLLAQIPATQETHEYVTRMLGPVASDPQLLRTLEVFLERGGNKVAAAAAIPLHRSSLMYRLDKISRLLDIDLHEPERFLELWLAIRLRRIIG
jgi:DNA-binding PucR family transcriptional regulator